MRQIEPYTWKNVYSDVYNQNTTLKQNTIKTAFYS